VADEVVIRFRGEGGNLEADIKRLADELRKLGSSTPDKPLRDTSKATTELAQALGTTYKNAQQFTNQLGLTAQKSAEAVTRLRELDRVNATNVEKFRALSREMGINRQQFDQLNQATARSREGMQGLAVATGAIAASLTAVGAKGVQQFADFDKAIRTFGVVTQSSGTEALTQLRGEVERLAAVTTKTPQEIANVAVELGKAGFTAEQTRLALAGVVQSSEATGEGLARTGEVIGATLNQFGLGAEKSIKIADLLTTASNASAAGTNDLGEALSYVGAQAAGSNQTIEDTITTLALLANAGIKGSSAGTGLAEALRRIKLASASASTELDELRSRGSKSAVAAFELINQQVRDANGNLLPFPQVLDKIRAGLENLDQPNKELLLNALFGVQGGRVIQSLLGQTEAQINSVTGAMKNFEGASAQASQQMTQGLAGSLSILQSTADLTAQKIGENLAPALGVVVGAANQFLNAFLALPGPVQATLVTVGGFVAVLTAAIAVVTAYNLANGAFIVSETLKAAGLVASTVATIANTVATVANTNVKVAGAVATQAFTAAQGFLTATLAGSTAAMGTFTAALGAALPPLLLIGAAVAAANFIKLTNDLKNTNESLDSLGEGARVSGDAAISLASKTKALSDEIGKSGKATDEQKKKAQQLIQINRDQVKSLQDQLAQVKAAKPANEDQAVAQQALVANIEASIRALEGQTSALEKNVTAGKASTAATKDRAAAAKEEADSLKVKRDDEKRQQDETFQDDSLQKEQEFQDAKQERESAFQDQQQAKQETFQQKQQAGQEAFQERQQSAADRFKEAQQSKEDTFRQQQQSATDAFNEQQRQKQDAFNKQQQADQDAFQNKQSADRDAFDRQQSERRKQIDRNLQLGEAKTSEDRQKLQQQFQREDTRAAAFAPLEEERKAFEEKQKAEAEAQRIDQEEKRRAFETQLKEEEKAFQTQQKEEEKAFHLQQQQEEKAFKDQQRAEEKAFQAQQKSEEQAFKAQQRAEERAFKQAEQEAEREFKSQQRSEDRAFKEQQRAFDLETARQVKAILESAKPPTPTPPTSSPPPGRRLGGEVEGGNLYQVGEGGWEYFVPSQNGYIIRHEEAISLAREALGSRAPVPTGAIAPATTRDPILAELQTLRRTIERREPKAEFPVTFEGPKSEANFDRYYRFQRALMRGMLL
jgi:TP901 family phage tail tape measure protein